MYKSLLEVFGEKQVELLRTKMWWVADQDRPFLLKFATEGDFALLQLTDLRGLWVAKIHVKNLLEDKAKFAKSLQIKENKDLMSLFESLLTTSDVDALYTFKENGNEMQFTFRKRIQIFDFNWTFKLSKVNCNAVELVCQELLTPLAAVLQAQTRRMENLKKKFEQVEKDYIRKMTQMEKNLYKSPLLEDQEEWQQFLPKYQSRLLTLNLNEQSIQQLFSSLGKREKKVEKPLLSLPLLSDHKYSSTGKIRGQQRFQLLDTALSVQIQEQRVRQKREKKIDFI